MKKSLFIAIASCAVLFGCNKEISQPENPVGILDGKEKESVTIIASIAQTKTTATVEGSEALYAWQNEEKIKVLEQDSNAPSEFTVSDVASGSFSGTKTTGKDLVLAVSPAAALNSAEEDGGVLSYEITLSSTYNDYVPGTTNAVMVGTPNGTSGDNYLFTFLHSAAIAKVVYENVPVGTAGLSFSTDKNINGSFILDSATGVSLGTPASGSNETDLFLAEPVSVSGQTMEFFIPLPAATYTSFSVYLFDSNLNEIAGSKKSKTGISLALAAADMIAMPKITMPEDKVFFEERFTQSTGTMGWSGGAGAGTFGSDNEGWTTANEYGAGGSAKFGSGGKLGSAETPSITIGNAYIGKDVLLSFKAGAWNGTSENTNLKLSATGAKLFNDSNVETSSVTMIKGGWTEYTLHLKNITSSVKIKFEGNGSSNSRFFLDDVVVYYGTKPAESFLTVSPSEDQEVSYNAGTKDYAVTYTIDGVGSDDWSVSTSSEGFSVAKNATGTGFTVSYSKNNGAERTGEIVVTGGSKTQTVKIIQGEKSLTDELTAQKIGVSSYSNWDNITDMTGIVYAGNSTKTQSDEIQLRSNTSSGIVSTTTIGYIKKIVVDWGSSLSTARTLDIYGSNVAYESSADLYDNTKRGTKIGSLSFTSASNNETELTVTGDYAYVGVRSSDGALYLNFIKFTYEEDNREDPGMSWNPTSATATITNSGTSFTAPTLNLGNASSVTYNSTAPSVATVESNGTVNILAAGSTTIQAIFAGDATYKPSTKEYTLTVTDERTFLITVTQPAEGGTISVNPSGSQIVGTDIALSADASSGYVFKSWNVYKTGEPTNTVDVNNNAFNMPAYPVTVTAVFEKGNDPVDYVDVLTRSWTNVTNGSTSYSSWSSKNGSASSAVYAGNSAGDHDSIQLRSNNSNSGVISTASGGKVKKIVVTWESNTASGRTLNVYGKNSAYSAASELYNSSNQGTLLGTIVCGTSTELTITGDYTYVGFRSASGAMYLSEVKITWQK